MATVNGIVVTLVYTKIISADTATWKSLFCNGCMYNSLTMVEEMKKYLYLLLGKVDGLLCILITDRDGVPILKVAKNEAPDYAMRPSFISTFGMATEQARKLGLGKNKSVICTYSKYQVIQINKLPMVVTFIAMGNSNTGHILSLEEQIDPLLNDLKCAIVEA